MTPPRRTDQEQRCTTFQFCGLAGGHPGECAVIPEPGFQETFLSCGTDGAIAAGTVGGGKTLALLMEALRHIDVAGYTALIVREQKDDLLKPGGLWAKAKALYPAFGGEIREADLQFTFASGATVQFSYVGKDYEARFQGSEIGFLGVDEITHLNRSEFAYLLGRLRCPALTAIGVRPYWRATCNPDRDSWVRGWVDWWIGADGWADPTKDGVIRYYLRRHGQVTWGATAEEVLAQHPGARRSSVRSFAFLNIDKIIRFISDEYEGAIDEQDEETALRMRGNWNAGAQDGKIFRREWFRNNTGQLRPDILVDAAPPETRWCRGWDLAATPEALAVSGTSETAGVKVGLHDGIVYLGGAEIGQWDAGTVEKKVEDTAADDGREVQIWICRERAGAGKSVLDRFVRLLQGYDVDGDVESGEKEVRLRPLAAQAKHGHIRLVRHESNERLVQRLLRLPARPDDVGDAAAAAYERLAQDGRPTTEGDLRAIHEANPVLNGGGGGRSGGAQSQPGGRGRFAPTPFGPGRMRLGPRVP